ncbi:hypothetical protein HDZ31DRAFT_61910 [Schizophyllum fasciatum]
MARRGGVDEGEPPEANGGLVAHDSTIEADTHADDRRRTSKKTRRTRSESMTSFPRVSPEPPHEQEPRDSTSKVRSLVNRLRSASLSITWAESEQKARPARAGGVQQAFRSAWRRAVALTERHIPKEEPRTGPIVIRTPMEAFADEGAPAMPQSVGRTRSQSESTPRPAPPTDAERATEPTGPKEPAVVRAIEEASAPANHAPVSRRPADQGGEECCICGNKRSVAKRRTLRTSRASAAPRVSGFRADVAARCAEVQHADCGDASFPQAPGIWEDGKTESSICSTTSDCDCTDTETTTAVNHSSHGAYGSTPASAPGDEATRADASVSSPQGCPESAPSLICHEGRRARAGHQPSRERRAAKDTAHDGGFSRGHPGSALFCRAARARGDARADPACAVGDAACGRTQRGCADAAEGRDDAFAGKALDEDFAHEAPHGDLASETLDNAFACETLDNFACQTLNNLACQTLNHDLAHETLVSEGAAPLSGGALRPTLPVHIPCPP